MSDLTRHIARAGHCRVLLALVLLLALAGTADRLAAAYGPLGGSDHFGCRMGLSAAERAIPHKPSEKMAGSSKPIDGSSVCLLIEYLLNNDSSNGRTRLHPILRAGPEACVFHPYDPSLLCPTASLIDSDLGRQFTLVGARPSGTS